MLLRSPWLELQSLKATGARLTSKLNHDDGSAAALGRVSRELDAADKAMTGGLPRSDDAMVPYLISTIDAIAARHRVSFGGVKPPVSRLLGNFEEISFHIEARGSYPALFDWLREVLKEVDPLVTTEVSVKAIDDGQRVAFVVRLAAYRLPAAVRHRELAK